MIPGNIFYERKNMDAFLDFGFFHSVGCGDSIITKCFNGISVVENRIPTVQIYYVICGIYYGVCCS